MTNPSMPQMPGAGAMSDTLEFMKNLWGNVKMPGVTIPGMVMPSLSVEEINKQIADLKAVESWLTVNMNMLHGTIKALEVQSATISTLQSMSANFSSAMQPPAAATAEAPAPFHSPFHSPFTTPTPPVAEVIPEPAPEPIAKPMPKTTPATEVASDASAAAQLPNPAAWWNMLQDQFKQAVAGAIPEPQKSTPKAAGKANAASKSRATKATSTSTKKTAAPKKRTSPGKS